jgi:hypothetical protein
MLLWILLQRHMLPHGPDVHYKQRRHDRCKLLLHKRDVLHRQHSVRISGRHLLQLRYSGLLIRWKRKLLHDRRQHVPDRRSMLLWRLFQRRVLSNESDLYLDDRDDDRRELLRSRHHMLHRHQRVRSSFRSLLRFRHPGLRIDWLLYDHRQCVRGQQRVLFRSLLQRPVFLRLEEPREEAALPPTLRALPECPCIPRQAPFVGLTPGAARG